MSSRAGRPIRTSGSVAPPSSPPCRWTKSNHPSAAETAARDRILGWAAGYVSDPDWFIQKSVSWWLRSLSIHDPDRVRAFLDGPGRDLRPFARKDAASRLV